MIVVILVWWVGEEDRDAAGGWRTVVAIHRGPVSQLRMYCSHEEKAWIWGGAYRSYLVW